MFSIEKLTKLEEQGDKNKEKESREKTFWKSIDFYKNNWTFLVFIPTAVGGFVQLFQLLWMDPSYGRFFAVEQVIPDGLLIVFFFSFGLLTFYGLKKAYMPPEKLKIEWKIKNVWNSVKRPLVVCACVNFIIFYINYLNIDPNPPLIFIILELVLKAIALMLFLEFLVIIRLQFYFRNYKNPLDEVKENIDKNYKSIFYVDNFFAIIIYSLILISLFIYLMITFLNIFQKVNNFSKLINEPKLLSEVSKKLKLEGEVSVQYYNGKYIFIRTIKDQKEEYLVLKGEILTDLFNDKDK
ncbi:hypothetical protein F3J02_03545 [Acinetobacter sp. Tr-809]|uniref:hypothetical protein n=1 Tax=Acinetobacter sp. Tr-809 TaxID=2608324 RepID=UPI00142191ED|nr:hypothetical protein [Acinetobacter sp. Tr-809]NIE95565.1 hypothetical protein [Acinetobacter sp. Tr-809]